MLLAALVAGIAGTFLPFVEVHTPILRVGFTAFDLTFKMERTHKLVDTKLPAMAKRRLKKFTSAQEDLQLALEASRFAAFAFIPAVLLGVLGAIGLFRRHVGRFIGAISLLLGLASVATWIGLRMGVQYAVEEADLGKTTVGLAIGANLVLVVGGIAILAGLGALFAPDTKEQMPVTPRQAA
jgi:hypothetical protein